MKKLKDLIYDYNDIVLALIIIIIAGAIIFWKVTDVMAYPSFIKSQQQISKNTDIEVTDEDLEKIDVDPIKPAGEDLQGGDTDADQNPQPDNQDEPQGSGNQASSNVKKDTKFTVPSGYTGSKIASKLEKEGLCTVEAFNAAVESLKAETKLRAGDFTIPAGSTAEDIVKIIANIK